ncbi:MAG: RNA pseudouridine synthase [Candidatus Latescibacterota bacterium]|nr:MAG: RNA pseudouridine synthase [Candidatus Latescibacterota bacterium]
MSEERIEVEVGEDGLGVRLDVYLAGIAGSRSAARRWILKGCVEVEGRKAKPGLQLVPGMRIRVLPPEPEPLLPYPEELPLDILFEDQYIIVLNKSPGIPVHPGAGRKEGTLVHALLAHCANISEVGEPTRPGVVHRLDKDTSGVMVVAKTEQTHRMLSEGWKEGKVFKRYLAVVWGRLPQRRGYVDAPIGRHPRDRKRMAVVEGGRPARTEYEVLEESRFLSLLAVYPKTGRTHQIRVHMSHLGHPVFGDPKYGGRTKRLGGLPPRERRRAEELLDIVPRQALHSEVLGFVHPVTGGYMEFRAEPPEDMRKLLEELGWGT